MQVMAGGKQTVACAQSLSDKAHEEKHRTTLMK